MKIIITILGMISLLIIGTLATDFILTIKNGKGWVHQGRHGTAIKEFIKEEKGCVYFVDVWGTKGKTCGSYELKLY